MYGCIEGGGTKFVCAVGTSPDDIRRVGRITTTTPAQTMDEVVAFFKEAEADFGALKSIGFASFGPVDPEPASPTFGFILPTPKPGWSNANVVGMLKAHFNIPIAFDTDVNGSALGEWTWGAAQGLDTFIYITIGTGIGGGILAQGNLLHGLIHPETGHIPLPRDKERDPFEGNCPFHGDCFEGLASGPAIEKRWGQKAETLAPDHPAWDLEAHYIALALASYIYTLSPQRIILGGGVLEQPFLLPMIRQKVKALLNGYIQSPAVGEKIDEYIVAPGLGSRSGMLGAFAMAQKIG